MRRTVIGLLLVSVLVCPGCLFARYVHVPDRYPVYELPPKTEIAKVSAEELEPLTTKTKMKIVSTVTGLKSEVAQLRALLKSYNEYARSKNKVYDERFKKEKASTWRFWRNSSQ